MNHSYDAIIIGAGMSGLAAGIRLAMFDQKVLIIEKHTIAGGLNSFYARSGRKLDVGLHAMTNFARKGERGRPLTKLLKQLRIPYDEFSLGQQLSSRIVFPRNELNFSNDINDFVSEVNLRFPDQVENFKLLLELMKNFDETSLDNPYESAKERVSKIISDQDLIEMIFCPLLIYGSAWENDMDFSQFVVMFKSIFLEGFSRPEGGVRKILGLLLKRYKSLGGEIKFRTEACKILRNETGVSGIQIASGDILYTNKILSSMGLPETFSVTEGETLSKPKTGKLSFTESILCFGKKPIDHNIKDTIVFYSKNDQFNYCKPDTLFDHSSAVICLPNNFAKDDYKDGMIRLTFLANYDKWKSLDSESYKKEKENVLAASLSIVKKIYPQYTDQLIFHDVFTPTTIQKFTGHFSGTVYGSTDKSRDGRTEVDGLYICGTDQGFLGIVGAMLSGISMANLHCLMETT